MRFQLTLTKQKGQSIPLNYQYELSAWLYRVIQTASPDFSRFLHEQGYQLGSKQFKLFTFSNLLVPKFRIDKEKGRLLIQSPEVHLLVSFVLDEAAEHFITGLFLNQHLGLGDREGVVDFTVMAVEAMPSPTFTQTTRFRTLSPLCIAKQEERNGRLMPQYCSPQDADYESRLFDNLIHKYLAYAQHQFEIVGEPLSMESLSNEAPTAFRLLSEPKSRLITIKKDTPNETRVRGFLFDFQVQATPEVLAFAYDAGFGEKGSMGFGCVEVRG